MIKVSAFLPKRADLTDEQFHAHWRHPHGDLAVRTQRIRRYVQLHGIARRSGFRRVPRR